MNNAYSSYFNAVYDRLLHFWGINGLLRDCSQDHIFLALGMWECSFVVEHSTADQEIGGSIPLAPFFIVVGYLWKDFRSLKE